MKRPLWVTALILFCFPVFGSVTDPHATGSNPTAASAAACFLGDTTEATAINDPLKLPFFEWSRVKTVGEVAPKVGLPVNFYVDTDDFPITTENLIATYRLGGKLYQHFDRVDLTTGRPETHRWEFPAYRGLNTVQAMKATLTTTAITSKMMKSMYLHRLPHATKKNELVLDLAKPAYVVRINYEPGYLIDQCARSERLLQNTTTKEKIRDINGHSVLTTATWFSKDVQSVLKEMIARGMGYTVGVYTTAHHPKEIETNSQGGKLVAGAIGIVVDGVYTGISLFMDRSHVPNKKNDLFYDGAGRLAFFGELDLLESIGVTWVDSVTVNQAARDFGGRFFSRPEFHKLMAEAALRPVPMALPADGTWALRFARWERTALLNELKPK